MAFSDTFTGSNGAALNSTNWETPTGASAPLINTNAAYGTGTASIARQKAVTSNDQYAEATIGSLPVNAEGLGPAVRISGTAKTGYLASCSQWDDGNDYGPQITLFRCVNGSYTGLGTYTGAAYSSLGAVRITISGYAITVTDGGTTRISYTDTSGSKIASGNPGIWFQQNSSAYRLDNYTATDQSGGTVNATEGYPAAATTSSGSMGQTAGTITTAGFAGAALTSSASAGEKHSSSTGFAGASSTSSGSVGQTVSGITYPKETATYSDDFQNYTVGSSVVKLADGVSFSSWKSPTNLFPFARTESGRTGLGVGSGNNYPTVVWEAPISPNHYSACDFVRGTSPDYRNVILYVRGQRYSAQGYSLTFSQQYDANLDTYYEQVEFRLEAGSNSASLGTARVDSFATPTKIRLEASSVDANSPVRLRAFADDILIGTAWDSAGTFQSGYPGLTLNLNSSSASTHVLVDDWSTGVVAIPPTSCTVGFAAAVTTAAAGHGLPVSLTTGFAGASSTASGSIGLPVSTTVAFPAVALTSSSSAGQVTSRAKASTIYPTFSAFGGLDSFTGLQKGQITANGDPTIGYRLGISNDGTKGDRVLLTVPATSLLRNDTPSNPVGKATLHVTFLSLQSWDYLSGSPAWSSRSYARAEYVTNAGNVYYCHTAGTSTAAPTGTGTGLTPGGTAVWDFVRTHSAPNPSGVAFNVRKATSATWGATLSGSYGTVTAKPVWLSGQTWYDGATRGNPVWECEIDITTLYNESAQPGTDLILCLECALSDPRWVAELAGSEMAWARPRIEVHRYTASTITLSDTDTACPTLTVTPGSGSTLGQIRWSYDEALTPQGGVFKYSTPHQVEGIGTASPFTFPMLESSARVFLEVEIDNGANGTLVFRRSFKTPQIFTPKLEAKSGTFGSDWLDVRGPCLAPPTASVEAWYLLAKRTTSEWATGTAYPAGAAVVANGKRWFTKTGGTSGATAPATASTSGVSDGAVTWFPVQNRGGSWKAGAIGDFWELYRCTDAAHTWKHHVGSFDASNVNTVDPLPWPSYDNNAFTYNGSTYLIYAGPDVTLDALDVSHPIYEHHGRVAFLSTKIAGAGYEVRLNLWRHDSGGEVDWGVNNWPAGILESSVVLYTATAQPTLKELATVARAADWRHSLDRDPYTPLIAAFVADGHLRVYSVPTAVTFPDAVGRVSFGLGTPALEQNVAVSGITSVQALHLLTHEGEHRTIIAAKGSGAGWICSRADTTVTFTNGGGHTLGGGTWSTPITPTFEAAWVTETMAGRARGSSLTTGEIVEHLPDAETCCLAVQASNGVVTFYKGDLVQSACTVASLEPGADFGTGLLWNRSARVVGRWPTTGYARTVPTPNGGAFMLSSSGSTLSAYRVGDFCRVSDVKTLDVGATVQEILVQRDGFAWEGQRVPIVTKHADGYRTALVTVGVDPWKMHLPTPDQVARFSSGKATVFQGSPNMRPVHDVERLAGHNVFQTGWSFDEFRSAGGMMNEAGWCYVGFEHADGERIRLIVHDTPSFGGKWRNGTLIASTYDTGFHPECIGGAVWPQNKFATWFFTNDPPSTPDRQWKRVLDGMDYVLDGESGGGAYIVCVKSSGPLLWLAHDMVSDIATWEGDVSKWIADDSVKISSQQRVKWVNGQGELLDVNGGILSQVRTAP